MFKGRESIEFVSKNYIILLLSLKRVFFKCFGRVGNCFFYIILDFRRKVIWKGNQFKNKFIKIYEVRILIICLMFNIMEMILGRYLLFSEII